MPWLLFLIATTSLISSVDAQSFRICTQNLQNFGVEESKDSFEFKVRAIGQRIASADCDVVAFQEISNASGPKVAERWKGLIEVVSAKSKKAFRGKLARSNNERLRNGLIYADSRLELISFQDLYREPIPSVNSSGQVSHYPRGPFKSIFRVKKAGQLLPIKLVLIGFHLKSKSGGWRDPAQSWFEVWRAETAEAIRREAVKVLKQEGENIVVLLGDLNSSAHSPTSMILRGAMTLEELVKNAETLCKVEKGVQSECSGKEFRPPVFSPVFSGARHGDGPFYSYIYRGRKLLLDEIYLNLVSGWKVSDFGTIGELGVGSDHKLLWLELESSQAGKLIE